MPPAFSLPADMPERMLVYDQFAEMYGWHPREVDRLDLDELEWLPVVRTAKANAAEQLRDR